MNYLVIKFYIPCILLLKSLGYKIIFGGNERMPNEFKEIGVIDFKTIRPLNIVNEFSLIKGADLVITCGSGYAYLASVLGVKLLLYTHVKQFLKD